MTPLTKSTAYRIEAMESAHLISYKHHIPWAESIIEALPTPPYWILELSRIKYIGDVRKLLRSYVFSEPFEEVDEGRYCRDYVASHLIRYRRRELSWASFLDSAGRFTDPTSHGDHPCEYFFEMLNQYEDSDFSADQEAIQSSKIVREYDAAVHEITPLYLEFRKFYPTPRQS